MADENVLTETRWEVHYEYQVSGTDAWFSSYTQSPLPDEATALDLFEGFFNKPCYRNVEVVEVVRNVVWQRTHYGAATTIVKAG